MLSPEARDLRPLLLSELTHGLDLLLRDRLRRTAAALPTLLPRLPSPLGALLPGGDALAGALGGTLAALAPPVPVPGRGLVPPQQLIDELAPPLSDSEGVRRLPAAGTASGALARPAAAASWALGTRSASSLLDCLRQQSHAVCESPNSPHLAKRADPCWSCHHNH